ncbi:MAG: RNA polymerase sigma factor [Stenotrophomonas sp.]
MEDVQGTGSLLDYFGQNYTALKQRLVRRLGNRELAGDALHDTWLRLNGAGDIDAVRDPASYLTRMAVNIAIDVQRRNSRMLSGAEIDALLDGVADPAPEPARAFEVHSDLTGLMELLDRMPARRRAVALLVHAEGLTQKAAAQRLGVSLRTVEYELQKAHQRLAAYAAAHDGKK